MARRGASAFRQLLPTPSSTIATSAIELSNDATSAHLMWTERAVCDYAGNGTAITI